MVRLSDTERAHAFCVVKTRGLDALAALSSKEIGKIRISEIRGLGLDADQIFELLEAAEKREAQAT